MGDAVTGLEFLAAGVTVRPGEGGWLRVLGPTGASDLMEQMRFEILVRKEIVAKREIVTRERYRCELCGDQIGHDRHGTCPLCPTRECRTQSGGWCMLCVIARTRWAQERTSSNA